LSRREKERERVKIHNRSLLWFCVWKRSGRRAITGTSLLYPLLFFLSRKDFNDVERRNRFFTGADAREKKSWARNFVHL
jgi:hypothetical protein